LTPHGTAERLADRDKSGLRDLQKIEEIEARASHRAKALESIRRALKLHSARPSNVVGVVDRGSSKQSDTGEEQTEALRRDEERAEARLKIAVDELLAAHCEILRMSSFGQALLVPAESALLEANESYQPWERVLRFGRLAIKELTSAEFAHSESEQVEARERAREAIDGFVNSIDLLARVRPESELSLLKSDLASRWDRDIEIANATAAIEAQCTAEKAAVAAAQAQLEVANQQIIEAAWLKIPARLRSADR